jgi:uncharacterized protein
MLRLLTLMILVAVLLALLAAAQRKLIYFPSSAAGTPGRSGLPHAEPVTYETEDGLTLQGWFVPAANGENARQRAPAVLFLPGNAGHRAMRAPLAARLSERGLAVLLVDYRGYGDNPGSPSEEALARARPSPR